MYYFLIEGIIENSKIRKPLGIGNFLEIPVLRLRINKAAKNFFLFTNIS